MSLTLRVASKSTFCSIVQMQSNFFRVQKIPYRTGIQDVVCVFVACHSRPQEVVACCCFVIALKHRYIHC